MTFFVVVAAVFWATAAAIAYVQGNHGWAWIMLVFGALVALDLAEKDDK